jgi:GTP1/Obg family GTP-binding protein
MPVKAFDGKEFDAAGKILALDSAMEASLLRTVNDLYPSINAVMIDMRVTPMTLENLVNCRKVADFTGQHVIAQVNKSLTRAELMALRDSRVKSLVLPADTSAAELARVVNDISELPAVDKKKDQGSIALIPRIETRAAAKEDEGGDDDDD